MYEYLLHVGAQKAAQTFLNEAREGVNNKILVAYMSANGGGGGGNSMSATKTVSFLRRKGCRMFLNVKLCFWMELFFLSKYFFSSFKANFPNYQLFLFVFI